MKKKNKIYELDLYLFASLMFKNKIILMWAVIIGIILTIISENFKNPYKPIYEITSFVNEISLFEEQKYDQLNNHLKFYKSNYLPYFSDLGSKDKFDETILNETNNYKIIDQLFNASRQKYYDKLELINSDYLMSIFIRIFQEETSLSNYDLMIIDQQAEQTVNTNIKRNSALKIKLISDKGDFETWKEILQNEIKKINEDVRQFLYTKYNTEISILEKHYDFLIEDLSLVGKFKVELKNLSNRMISRQINFLKGSPINYPEKFSSINFNNNLIQIKILNESDKHLSIEKRIIVSIIISLIVGVAFILILENIKRITKRTNK